MLFLHGHRHAVRSVAWSPRGDLLASGGDDHSVRLWRLLPGQLAQTLQGHERNVYAVAFTPNGRTVISAGGDGRVRMWSVERGYMGATPEVHSRSVNCLAMHRSGSVATGDGGGRSSSRTIVRSLVNRRRAPGGATLRSAGPMLTLNRGEVSCLAYSPDGRQVAVGTPDILLLWSPRRESGRVMRFGAATPGSRPMIEATASGELSLLAESGWYRAASFSPDGERLAAAAGDDLFVWNHQRRTVTKRCAHNGTVHAVAFSPLGGLLASAGEDGAVRLWDADRGAERVSFVWNIGPVYSLAFSPNGLALAAGGQGRIVVWDVEEYY